MEAEALVMERKIIGVLIRAAREKAHCTIRETAQRVGVSPGRVRAYEMGTRDISLPELERLALYLNMPLSFFLHGGSTQVQPAQPAPPTPDEMRVRRSMIGAKLKQARMAAGKNKEECAQAIARTTGMLARYERGQVDIPVAELERLANLLGVNMTYFVQDGGARREVFDLENWSRLPSDVRTFVLDPNSLPYLRMAQKFRDLPAAKLQELGEILLVVR